MARVTDAMLQNWLNLDFYAFLPFNMVETVDLSLFLPPSNTSRHIIAALDRNAKLIDKEGRPKEVFNDGKWRKFCKLSSGWIDCWQVPELQLNIGYTYHPIPHWAQHLRPMFQLPKRKNCFCRQLGPLIKEVPMEIIKNITPEQFDPTSVSADVFTVELRIIRPSDLKLYGTVLHLFINLKENIFGEDQNLLT
ncbi:bridge-like lipid transfer protein family member 1 [Macrobrachium rosenbergii]|uniref:bridge-like lipid transfer protein family member 1 n=1 Tax=Macrobrachium rosenbergii TaxID=79674 RepID=UPI0034D716E6